jgi:amidase
MMMEDRIGAFVAHGRIDMLLSDTGPLAGTTFAVKDFFDVAGLPTGAGSPDWLASHAVPQASASVVDRLLNAGARLVGKTSTDELAWSLNGENYHYGTPINPAAPKRIPGGSSSGSVVAVAGELVDFAVGSDTGGSVRLPASYCGVFGMRPTHARIPLTGAVPLAPSYDTVGWFARSGDLLEQVGRVLIPEWREPATPPRFLIADDIFEAAGSAVKAALAGALESFGPAEHVVVADGGLTAWRDAFRIIQASEVWQAHSGWVAEAQPGFGPGIRERFADAARLDSATIAEALRVRQGIRERLDALLGKDGILLLPSAPGAAPLRGTPAQELEAFRAKALELLCGAGHAGLPQVSMPLGAIDGCPIGLSAMAPRGHDERLLQLVGTVTRLHG